MISPQTALPTSPTPSAFSITPTFRGLRKWSITVSLYRAIANTSLNHKRSGAALQVPPHRGHAAQPGDGPGHGVYGIVDLFFCGLLREGEPQRPVRDLVRAADGQQHVAGVQRTGGTGRAGGRADALVVQKQQQGLALDALKAEIHV